MAITQSEHRLSACPSWCTRTPEDHRETEWDEGSQRLHTVEFEGPAWSVRAEVYTRPDGTPTGYPCIVVALRDDELSPADALTLAAHIRTVAATLAAASGRA